VLAKPVHIENPLFLIFVTLAKTARSSSPRPVVPKAPGSGTDAPPDVVISRAQFAVSLMQLFRWTHV
jgi:hypothetical protein